MLRFMNKCILLSALLAGSSLVPASGALLFLDNFNDADDGSFDGSFSVLPPDRMSGPAAAETALRSWGAQQSLISNQMNAVGNGGVRFGGQTTRYNWAGATTGSTILGDSGFIVSFLWTPPDNTSDTWVSFQVGTINNDSGNLTHGGTDYGILFRNDGRTERFDNGLNLGAAGTLNLPGGQQRLVEITYSFNSFADGTSVTAVSKIDGTQLASDTFTWDGNGGELRMELGAISAGSRIDNLMIASIPEPSAAALCGTVGLLALRRRRQR